MLACAQVRILVANRFILAKGSKETLQDKRASPAKKASAGTKEDVPAGIHHGNARGWGERVWPGCEEAYYIGGLSYAGWLGIVSPQLKCTNTQAVVCQSHPSLHFFIQTGKKTVNWY